MKKTYTLFVLAFLSVSVLAGTVEKTFHISNVGVTSSGLYQNLAIENAKLAGIPGEPTLPYLAVSLMLPPGESAMSMEVIRTGEVLMPGTYSLFPKQDVVPFSKVTRSEFRKNESVYRLNAAYPASPEGHLLTQYLNGYAFALSTFTPVSYNPATGKVSYYTDVTIKITTKADSRSQSSLKNLTSCGDALQRVRSFAQNPEMMNQYPEVTTKKTSYQILIITPVAFEDGFRGLVTYYNTRGITSQIQSVEDIIAGTSGTDSQEKIRNFIRQEYQNNNVEYVLLGGTEQLIPSRRFYCRVFNPGGGSVEQESYDIPADIYYSALDGTDDLNGNHIYGEEADSTDLLPDIAVGRLPFLSATDQASMIHKTVSYQAHPVLGEANNILLAGEYLYDNPITLGGPYVDLLAGNHNDNGYSTTGIPLATNNFDRLYDTLDGPPGSTSHYSWETMDLISKVNNGVSFIYHLGHANAVYMMRMDANSMTDASFYGANGVDHNYTLIYTQGCDDGSFDTPGCISSLSLSMNNFAVAGIFNTRFGWFDQGTTDGPSEHLQREFVSALWDTGSPEHHIGKTHMISKIKTAPWIGLPGEFEPGAQRWTQYDCTLLGDPALWIRTSDNPTGVQDQTSLPEFSVFPNPAHGVVKISANLPEQSNVILQILDGTGQQIGREFSWKSENRGIHTYSVDLGDLTPGIYFCSIRTDQFARTKKIVVVR